MELREGLGPLGGSSSLLSAHSSVFYLIWDQFISNSPSSSEQIGGFIMSLSLQVTQLHKYFRVLFCFLIKKNVSYKQRLLNVLNRVVL